jgi:hypothetical protein
LMPWMGTYSVQNDVLLQSKMDQAGGARSELQR